MTTARALFAEHGFHGTGIAQIAAESGVKVGQLYRDFPAKEAIVAAIVEADLLDFLDEAALRRAIEAGDLDEVRRWIGGFVCGRDREHSRLYPEICAEAARNVRIGAIMDGVEQRVRGDVLLALSALAPERQAAAEVVADLILTLKIGVANQLTVRPDRDLSALCARIETLIDAELEGLRQSAAPAYSAGVASPA